MAISVNSHKLSPVNDIPIVRLCGEDYNKDGEGKGDVCEKEKIMWRKNLSRMRTYLLT